MQSHEHKPVNSGSLSTVVSTSLPSIMSFVPESSDTLQTLTKKLETCVALIKINPSFIRIVLAYPMLIMAFDTSTTLVSNIIENVNSLEDSSLTVTQLFSKNYLQKIDAQMKASNFIEYLNRKLHSQADSNKEKLAEIKKSNNTQLAEANKKIKELTEDCQLKAGKIELYKGTLAMRHQQSIFSQIDLPNSNDNITPDLPSPITTSSITNDNTLYSRKRKLNVNEAEVDSPKPDFSILGM